MAKNKRKEIRSRPRKLYSRKKQNNNDQDKRRKEMENTNQNIWPNYLDFFAFDITKLNIQLGLIGSIDK